MSTISIESEIKEELSKERQILLEKLSTIFDPETAIDYVSPKTNETRQQLSLEELRLLNFNEADEYLQRLRSLVHYKTTTQSLSCVDLERSYESFVRNQVAEQHPRYELERFVRNSSDIDNAKHYLDMAKNVLINPQQSLLLFRSSKLNEQKASLLKSSGYSNSLQQMNEDPSIQKYFTQTLTTNSRYSNREDEDEDEEEFFHEKKTSPRIRSMHLKHNDKKYRVQFLKDYDAHDPQYRKANNRHLLLTEELTERNIESLFSADNSTIQGHSPELHTSEIHREIFPPLSLSAMKEYRPTVTPKPAAPSRKTSSSINIQQRRKPIRKADFIWQQSVASSTKQE